MSKTKIAIVPVLFLLLVCLSFAAKGQDNAKSIEKKINSYYGIEKLKKLNFLCTHYFDKNKKKSLKYGKQAVLLSDKIIKSENTLLDSKHFYLRPTAYLNLGTVEFAIEKYFDAKQHFTEAKIQASTIQLTTLAEAADLYLAKIDSVVEKQDLKEKSAFFNKLGNLKMGETINSSSAGIKLSTTLKLASNYEKNKKYDKAIIQYEKAILLLKNEGESDKIIAIEQKIADLHRLSGNYIEAIAQYNNVNENTLSDSIIAANDSVVNALKNEMKAVITYKEEQQTPPSSIVFAPNSNSAPSTSISETDSLYILASKFEEEKNYKQSLSYYKLYLELQEDKISKEKENELVLLDKTNQIENKIKEITLLKQDNEIQELRLAQDEAALAKSASFQKNAFIVGGLIVLLSFALFFLYRNKKKAHLHLSKAFEDLDKAKIDLEKAQTRIELLLKQQVSGAVASELLATGQEQKPKSQYVCVMFLDVRGFTPLVENKKPEEIIELQNKLFGFMIEIVHAHKGIINQLLGDGFMATFGAPIHTGKDSDNAIAAAQNILESLQDRIQQNNLPELKIGIGLHSGWVVVGNVGTEERMQYSVTGNTVIIAARIEQLNKDLESQILASEETVLQSSAFNNPKEEAYFDKKIKGRSKPIRILKIA